MTQFSAMATSVLSLIQNPTGDQSQVDGKRVRSRKDNFAFSFRPIYFLSRAFGLMPFSITYDSNGEIQEPRISRLDVLGFVIGICVQLILTYLHIRNVKASKDPNTAQYFLILCDYVLWVAIMIYGILLRGLDMYNRFKLVNILKDFTMFDKEVVFDKCSLRRIKQNPIVVFIFNLFRSNVDGRIWSLFQL